MIHIGCHLSVSDGYEAMGRTMLRFGGDTFAWFTRNPRGGKAKPIDAADAAALNLLLKTKGFGALVAHGSYTMNLCAANPQTLANGRDMLREDLERIRLQKQNRLLVGCTATYLQAWLPNSRTESFLAETQDIDIVLYRADKLSRNCFLCDAREDCYWPEERKNRTILC